MSPSSPCPRLQQLPPFPFVDVPASSTLNMSSSLSSAGAGSDEPWTPIRAFKIYTLVFVLPKPDADEDGPRVLLGLKQRGAFAGIWNGFGGKVEPSDRSVAAAARRELQEEAGIRATDLSYRGRVVFGPGEVDAEVSIDMRLYACSEWEGEILASEEMGLPLWFPAQLPPNRESQSPAEPDLANNSPALTPILPTAAMHDDALLYLPYIFAGRSILARFDYARPEIGVESGPAGSRSLQRWWIGDLEEGMSSGVGSDDEQSRRSTG